MCRNLAAISSPRAAPGYRDALACQLGRHRADVGSATTRTRTASELKQRLGSRDLTDTPDLAHFDEAHAWRAAALAVLSASAFEASSVQS